MRLSLVGQTISSPNYGPSWSELRTTGERLVEHVQFLGMENAAEQTSLFHLQFSFRSHQ